MPGLRETLEAATPLAQQFAKVREWLPESAEVLPMDERNPFAALAAIERHVQDMAQALRTHPGLCACGHLHAADEDEEDAGCRVCECSRWRCPDCGDTSHPAGCTGSLRAALSAREKGTE